MTKFEGKSDAIGISMKKLAEWHEKKEFKYLNELIREMEL